MSSEDLARRAALRLANELDRNLPAAVESQIHGGSAGPSRFEPATAIALATLILGVAKFAWDIYRDTKKDAKPPAPDVIARQVRLKLDVSESIDLERRDRIISVVIDELVTHPPAA